MESTEVKVNCFDKTRSEMYEAYKRGIKKLGLFEEFVEGLEEGKDYNKLNPSPYGNCILITSLEQYKKIRAHVKEKVIEGCSIEISAPALVSFVGGAFLISKNNEEDAELYDRNDVIRITYHIKIKSNDNIYNSQEVDLDWYMPRDSMPEEFTKKGCHFKEVEVTRKRVEFVCDGGEE